MKIKIFLGAYINSANAQNINCRSICESLNKDKFETYSLRLYSGNTSLVPSETKLFTCFYPLRISKYIGYLWGIYKCDIAYLPKFECNSWNLFWLKLLKKKYFSTIEGVLAGTNLEKAEAEFGSKRKMLKVFASYKNLYSITGFLRDYNHRNLGIKTNKKVLYLGTNFNSFYNPIKEIKELKNVVMIGHDLLRKGFKEYLELARLNKEINFHIVGSGNGYIDIKNELDRAGLINCKYHGLIANEDLRELLNDIDLHIFLSRVEGFPKVILETSSAGVPNIIFPDYGASEWMKSGKNGFILNNIQEIQDLLVRFRDDPKQLQELSLEARQLGATFSWNSVIKDWENEILKIYKQEND